jgi:hypothetical protein
VWTASPVGAGHCALDGDLASRGWHGYMLRGFESGGGPPGETIAGWAA